MMSHSRCEFSRPRFHRSWAAGAAALALSAVAARSGEVPLIDLSNEAALGQCKAGCDQVTFARSADASAPGLVVKIAAGKEGYPGLHIKPPAASWDLSPFGHVEARIANTSDQTLQVGLRLDNDGDWRDDPWNAENITIKAGQTVTGRVIFGYHYGFQPGYKLDASKVVRVLIFTEKAKKPVSFRIESLVAAGPAGEKPPVRPEDARVKPVDGYVLGGGGAKVDAAKQLDAQKGATAQVVAVEGRAMLDLKFPANKDGAAVLFRPPAGRWDFTQATEMRVRLKNEGATPVTPGAQARSDWHHGTDLVFADKPLGPGAEVELVVPFAPAVPWRGPSKPVTGTDAHGEPGTGSLFAGDKADAIKLVARHEGGAALRVQSIRVTLTPADPPEWLGKRPPVDGDWAVTFDDDFNGGSVDLNRWNIYAENYWDRRSHFSKDNLILGDGKVRLRMERKAGHENDDPKRKRTNYAVGFLDTFGKWTQRYGYFEARVKLPTSPGLWPAFWLMPDRGAGSDPQWKRSDTGNGGMEFDIMEHLTRWGPHRYNIAMHWDGYHKDHKSVGSASTYVRPDQDGFLTSGLLWTPGSAVFYCNGRVVGQWTIDRISRVPSYLMFDMVTGGWDNNPLDDAQLPADFVIDYVRVWQRKDLAQAAGP